MIAHNDLAERIERADGPDLRELECRVWAMLDDSGLPFEAMQAVVPDLHQWVAPPYLRSIDHTMQLVPDGWTDVRQHHHRMTDGSIRAYAEIEYDIADMTLTAEGRAATPAQALAAAALRAQVQP